MAHAREFRRDGVTSYITHPEAVANRLKHECKEVVAVAWLHDVLEDSPHFSHLLIAYFPQSIIQSVQTLTHGDENYFDYIKRVKADPIARKVKIADILHNLSDAPTKKQLLKYSRALIALLEP